MYGNSVEAFQRAQAIPSVGPAPEPEAPSSTAGGLWRAVRNAVPAAAAESLAMVAKGASIAFDDSPDNRGPVRQFGEEVERSLRNVAESYAPDPMTASKAEQVVFGLTRGVGKAVGYGLTTGPAAPLLFGVDEGLTEREKLLRQGVDEATAGKVGMVAGAVNTLGFAIPAAGSTVAKTIGLATLSGPASFVAQQAGSREILRNADYESIASSYDPTDALGLSLSAIPFGFGAWAMRGRFKSAKPAPEAKPAVVNESLTTQPAPDAIPVEPVRAADELGVSPDIAPVTPDIAARSPDVVPEPIVRQEHVDAAMVKNLVDFDQAASENPPPAPIRVFHGTPDQTVGFDELSAAGSRDMTSLGVHFTTARETAQLFAGESGRVLEGQKLFESAIEIPDQGTWAAWNVARAIDEALTGEKFKENDQSPLEAKIWQLYEDARIASLDAEPEGIQQLRDNFFKLTPEDREILAKASDRASKAGSDVATAALKSYLHDKGFDAIKYKNLHEGEPVDTFIDIGKPPPPTPKETPADVPTPAKLGEETREAPAPEGKAEVGKAAEGAADAATVAVYKSEAERILETNPDMVVDVDAQGNKVTARDAMEKIRREAAEGTATELGADDAKLVKVAAECALSFGE